MKMSFAVFMAGVVLFLAAPPLMGQDKQADPDKTYDIKAKYAVGDLLKYKMQMNMNLAMTVPTGASPFPGGEMIMSSGIKYKTVAVKPDGSAVIVMQAENAQVSMMGNAMPTPPSPPITMEVDARGVGKMRSGLNTPGMQALSQVMNLQQMPTMGVVLPDHPVKIGDSWDSELPSTMGKIKLASTLLGVEAVGGVETLRIKMVTIMPLDIKMGKTGTPVTDAAAAMMIMTGTAVTNSILNIQADNARIIKMAGDVKTDMKMEMKGEAASQSPFGGEMNMKMDGKMVMSLVSAQKVPAVVPAKIPSGSSVKTNKK